MKTRRLAVAVLLCSVPFVVSACSSSDGGGSNSTAGAAGASGGTAGASGGTAGASGGTAGASGGAGGSAASGFPDLDLAAATSTLTPAQAGELCDWINKSLGGYGLHTDCGTMGVSNDANQAACISNRLAFTCKVTVGQVKTCITAEIPSRYCEIDSTACGPLFCN